MLNLKRKDKQLDYQVASKRASSRITGNEMQVIYSEFRIQRRISIPNQVLKESIEIESSAMKYVEMLRSVHDTLGVLHCSILLSLHLHQELPQPNRAHHAVLRVLLEDLLDLRRRSRPGEGEPPAEAEAHSIRLLGHGLTAITTSLHFCSEIQYE